AIAQRRRGGERRAQAARRRGQRDRKHGERHQDFHQGEASSAPGAIHETACARMVPSGAPTTLQRAPPLLSTMRNAGSSPLGRNTTPSCAASPAPSICKASITIPGGNRGG